MYVQSGTTHMFYYNNFEKYQRHRDKRLKNYSTPRGSKAKPVSTTQRQARDKERQPETNDQTYKTSIESWNDEMTWECSGGIGFADIYIAKDDITQELDDQSSDVYEAYEAGMFTSAFNAALNGN